MEQSQRDHLQGLWVKLMDNISDVDGVVIGLFSKFVLTENLRDIILSKSTRQDRLQELLSILPRRGPEAYRHFYNVLVDRDEKVAADLVGEKLEEQSEEASRPPETWSVFHTLPDVDDELPQFWPVADCNPKWVDLVKVPEDDIDMKNKFERASTGTSPIYPMKQPVRGRFLLINNQIYQQGSNLPDRKGAHLDQMAMDVLFRQLGFYVVIKRDLTSEEIVNSFREQAACDHTDYDCFACAIFAAGEGPGEVYGVDGNIVVLARLQDALDGVNCPTLNGKPKLFFIQSCQGGVLDVGAVRLGTDSKQEEGNTAQIPDASKPGAKQDIKEEGTTNPLHGKQGKASPASSVAGELKTVTVRDVTHVKPQSTLPRKADFLTAYSTVPGFVSFRNVLYGSWFIQAVVFVFSRLARRYDILALLTRVNRLVSTAKSRAGGFKQMPTFTSTLTREFFFFPGLQHSTDTNADLNAC